MPAHARLYLREEPALDVENDGLQPLLIRFWVPTEIGRYGRPGQMKHEITSVNQLPIVGDVPHVVGLNYHVPIEM